MDEAWRTRAHGLMKKMAENIAESMGGSCTFRIVSGYPVLVNAEEVAERVAAAAGDFLGDDKVIETGRWMAAEDFAYYTQLTAGCFYLLGSGGPQDNNRSSLHNPTFDIDENALKIGAGLMAYLAIRELSPAAQEPRL
jgi:amidohydrolase